MRRNEIGNFVEARHGSHGRHGAYDGGFLQPENKNMVAVEMVRTEGVELAAPMVDLVKAELPGMDKQAPQQRTGQGQSELTTSHERRY